MTAEQRSNFAAWVTALTSGRFHKVRKVLRHRDDYCMFGVACELYREANPGCASWEPGVTGTSFVLHKPTGPQRYDSLPPHDVLLWLGLPLKSEELKLPGHWVRGNKEPGNLMFLSLNDGMNLSLVEIGLLMARYLKEA